MILGYGLYGERKIPSACMDRGIWNGRACWWASLPWWFPMGGTVTQLHPYYDPAEAAFMVSEHNRDGKEIA